MDETTSKKRLFGDWINFLNEDFQSETKWYIRPNLRKIGFKIKRNLLKKSPNYFLKIIDMDNELKKCIRNL